MKIIQYILFLVFSIYLPAQTLYEKQIIPFDGANFDTFGSAIAISDSFLFVSSPHYFNSRGEVYVYKIEQNDYIFVDKIKASDGKAQDLFGTKLLYENNQLFVGAINKRTNNLMSGPGAVYVFSYVNNNWVENQIIIPPEPYTFGGNFSSSISKYEDYLLIGAELHNSIVENTGKTFLYKLNNGIYKLNQEFEPPDPLSDQLFGSSVLIKNDLIVIGSASDSTESGIFSGSIYVYAKLDSAWRFSKKYIPTPNTQFLSLGTSICFSNEYIFVGTSANLNYNKPGKVYIYKQSNTVLDIGQIIETGDNYINDRFGISLFAKGDSLLIGAILDSIQSYNPGSVYLFTNENGTWTKKIKLSPSDENDALYFGSSCALNNKIIAIGAPESKYNGQFLGKSYLYSTYPLYVNDKFINGLTGFNLLQNYPNPFNCNTIVTFTIPKDGKVILKVFDVLGCEIKTIIEEYGVKGNYSVNMNLSGFPSGIYFFRAELLFEENNRVEKAALTRKAVLIN